MSEENNCPSCDMEDPTECRCWYEIIDRGAADNMAAAAVYKLWHPESLQDLLCLGPLIPLWDDETILEEICIHDSIRSQCLEMEIIKRRPEKRDTVPSSDISHSPAKEPNVFDVMTLREQIKQYKKNYKETLHTLEQMQRALQDRLANRG